MIANTESQLAVLISWKLEAFIVIQKTESTLDKPKLIV